MKKIMRGVALLLTFFLIACSGNANSATHNYSASSVGSCNSQTSESDDSSPISISDNVSESSDHRVDGDVVEPRVTGEMIYDTQVDIDSVYGSLTIEELPDFYRYIGIDGQSYLKEGDANPVDAYFSLYLADVNKDGYRDLCYVKRTNSSSTRLYFEVFDIKNNEVIFVQQNDSQFDYVIELRDSFIYVLQAKPLAITAGAIGDKSKTNVVSSGFLRYEASKGVYINWIVPEVVNSIKVTMYQEGEETEELDISDTVVVSTYFTYIFSVTIESTGEIAYPEISTSLIQPYKYSFDKGMKFRKTFANVAYAPITFAYQNAKQTIKIVVDDSKFEKRTIRDLYPELQDVTSEDVEHVELLKGLMDRGYYQGLERFEKFTKQAAIKNSIDFLDAPVCLLNNDIMPVHQVNNTAETIFKYHLKNGNEYRVDSNGDLYILDSEGREYYNTQAVSFTKGNSDRLGYEFSKMNCDEVHATENSAAGLIKNVDTERLYKAECSRVGLINYDQGFVSDYKFLIRGSYDIYVFDANSFGVLYKDPSLSEGLRICTFNITNEYTFAYLFDN